MGREAIRMAKCRGDCCLLLMPNRLLLEHSWPVVEQTTCHTPECRPTIAVIHEHLTQWPECQQALASNGISLARPAPSGTGCSAHMLARHPPSTADSAIPTYSPGPREAIPAASETAAAATANFRGTAADLVHLHQTEVPVFC